PTFLGARARAQDRETQSSLRNTVTAAKAIFTDRESYTRATPGALTQAEPTLTFVGPDTDTISPKSVSAFAPNADTFIAATRSASRTCWYIRDVIGGGGTMWNGPRAAPSGR